MRTILMSLAMVALLATVTLSAEKTAFVNGTFSIEVPEGWNVREDVNQLAVSIIHAETGVTRLIFATPYVNAKGDVLAVSDKNLDMMYMFFGDSLDITDEQDSVTIGGKNGSLVEYSADFADKTFHGRTFTFAQGDYVVISIGIALKDDFEKFRQAFTDMIASYEFNQAALSQNADLMQKLADTADENYEKMMAELEAEDEAADE